MKLNKMKTVQLETVTSVHIGTGSKTDRFDESVNIDYKSNKIQIYDYTHKMYIHNKRDEKEFLKKILKPSDVYIYEKYGVKYWIIKTLDSNKNEINILFDDEKFEKKINYRGKIKTLSELNLTEIEYWNVALQNPVALFPYNFRNFYIPASSIKGSISRALDEALNSNISGEKLFKETLFLNRCVGDCEIIDRNAMKIDVVNKIQYNLEESEKSVKIQTNPTNQKQFLKQGVKLNLSINEQLYNELLNYKKEMNKQLVQKLTYLNKKYEDLISEMISIKQGLNSKVDTVRINAINENLKVIGLIENNQRYRESTLAKNLQEIITTIERSEDIYLLLGSNKGKQLIFNQELDAFGLNFIDNMPIGIVKIDGGNSVYI